MCEIAAADTFSPPREQLRPGGGRTGTLKRRRRFPPEPQICDLRRRGRDGDLLVRGIYRDRIVHRIDDEGFRGSHQAAHPYQHQREIWGGCGNERGGLKRPTYLKEGLTGHISRDKRDGK
nr:hypothetical protein CFP56_44328 [Quercus suber]